MLFPLQLAISPSRLIITTGRILQSYKFTGTNKTGGAPSVKWEFSCNTQDRGVDRPTGDVTAIQFVPDGGKDLTVLISFSHGAVERIRLTPSNNSTMRRNDDLGEIFQPSLRWDSGDHVNSLSTADNYALSLSYEGTAVLFDAASPREAAPAAQTIKVGARGWATHLSLRASTPFAAFGTTSRTPLTVHAITNAELSPTPTTLLAAPQTARAADCAVYDIASGPPSSPWGSSDQILVSGWFSGIVRVHDLRVPARTPTAGLLPVMSLQDKWSVDSIYAVSCGGGGGSHIAAGSARNGVTRLWDVRAPADGWAVYAPGNDRSPVYDLVLESSRLFAATDSRAFVFDFGPGVTQDTYPRIQDVGLKPVPQGGCYVTKYRYADSLAF
jgi:WD40 repeat protein